MSLVHSVVMVHDIGEQSLPAHGILIRWYLKSHPHLPKKNCFICFGRPLQMIKKCFLFILKVLFILKIFNNFCSDWFGHVGKMTRFETQG